MFKWLTGPAKQARAVRLVVLVACVVLSDVGLLPDGVCAGLRRVAPLADPPADPLPAN